MKKLILLLTILFGLGIFVSLASAQETPDETQQRIIDEFNERVATEKARLEKMKIFFGEIEKTTVSIMHTGYGTGTCSGTIIREDLDKTYVLSAKHCISRDEQEIRVENNKVSSIRTAVGDDIVLLVVDGHIEGKQPALFGEYETVINEEIYHLSYPNWLPFRSTGYVIKEDDNQQYAVLKAMGGCSGGGIFNDEGHLVGILWGGFDLGGIPPTKKVPITIFEPLNDIYKFLEKIDYEI